MSETAGDRMVRHFRQILLWPLQLMPLTEGAQIQRHWEHLERAAGGHPWAEVLDEFGDPSTFQERHYIEFVTFLPYVQRFLYGEGAGAGATGYGESPIRVFRRRDITEVRMTYRDGTSLAFGVAHVDLYFFYDIDIVIPVVEIYADDVPFARVQDTLFRFGRSYPSFWDEEGRGGNCLVRAEWLAGDGRVLSASDYEDRDKYLSYVCRHRAPAIASHWEFLLKPMVLHHSGESGVLRYRQIEYDRMPLMSFLSLDDPTDLRREEFVALALVTRPAEPGALPCAGKLLEDFERRYCYDRFWEPGTRHPWINTRLLCSGHAFSMVGCHGERYFTDPETGLLGQFRHQYFLTCLIAHFHNAALLMLSDRLVGAVSRLDIHDVDSVKRFKRRIREIFEIFLRFTHRYWFHEISIQAQAKALFDMWRGHLGTDQLYAEVREEVQDMSQYLDSDSFRRQANTVVRLTVVTTFGLVGTVATGFLGMNLIAEGEAPLATKLLYFVVVFLPVAVLTLYTVMKSKPLSDFLEALSDERVSLRAKLGVLLDVWRKAPRR
ncbi:MAG TPA: hypothetical protein VF859_03030 [Burkholderiales bacterium]